MDFLKTLTLIFLPAFFLTGCQLGYYFSSASNQLKLLNNRVPIEQVLQDPKATDEEKRKLQLALRVREFAMDELHLKKTGNYTSYVKLNRPYATYVVSAASQWTLEHHLWNYPIVGKMPYKGFFDEASAQEEERSLREQHLDTHLRGVSAFSTLGWFEDPVLSSMFRYPDYEFVDTLIHETVHTTIYIKNSADFNERLAVFLGNKGMELFFLKSEGPGSSELKKARDAAVDDLLFSQFITKELNQLEKWYESQTEKSEDLRRKRLEEIQARYRDHIAPSMKTGAYRGFLRPDLDNADLLLYKTYFQDLSDFQALWDKTGQSFQAFLAACRQLEAHPVPEQGLKEVIQSLR